MELIICRALVIGGVLLLKLLCIDATKFIEEGKDFTLYCPQVNSSNEVTWSRNGINLTDMIGNISYHVTSASTKHNGVYTCAQSGFVEVLHVEVGRKPTVHRPVCPTSPNTTITCTVGAGDTPNTTVCLKVIHIYLGEREVGKKCNEGKVTFSLNLDKFHYQTFHFVTEASNPFGKTWISPLQFQLGNKVIPKPPINIAMYRCDFYSFVVSFTTSPTWKSGNERLKYSYAVTQENLSFHDVEGGMLNKKVPFKIKVERKPFSLVCLRVRLKYEYSDTWGEYSVPKCRRTAEAAPSSGPLSVATTSVQDISHPGYRNVTVTWEPPNERSRNGIIYQYSLTMETEIDKPRNGATNYDALMRVVVNGNVTRYTLSGIPSYQLVNITLKAWTQAGASPGTIYTIYPLLEPKAGTNVIVWVLVGMSCLAAFLISLKCFFITRSKLFSEHLPDPIFIHPSKIPRLQSAPPQREVFDALYRKPPNLLEVKPHRGIAELSTNYGDWSSFKENRGRYAFTGTDSGISCGTDNFSTNQSCRFSQLTSNRESNSVTEVCTYTGLPPDTNVGPLQWTERKSQCEEFTFSEKCSDKVNGCIPNVSTNIYSYPRYKRPPFPRETNTEKYVPMSRREEMSDLGTSCTDDCFVEDSFVETDMESDGYIPMKCSTVTDNKIEGAITVKLVQPSLSRREKKSRKNELKGEGNPLFATRSVATLQEALTNDECKLSQLGLKGSLKSNHLHAFRSCQNLYLALREESKSTADKRNTKLSSELIKCNNTPTVKCSHNTFEEDLKLSSNLELNNSRPGSRIERDSGYTSEN